MEQNLNFAPFVLKKYNKFLYYICKTKTITNMSVEKDFYTELAKTLISSIGNRTYHSSTIAGGDFDFKFSIVIYRDDNNKIIDIVPVWYEFHNKNLGENFEFDFDKLVETVKTI